MARKKSTIPPSIRLRDNQRRSRASHRAYVADLQAKLAAFEQRGVQASLALQQAARCVARENRALRELLARKGVQESEVEEFVRERARGEGEATLAGGGGGYEGEWDKLVVPVEQCGGLKTTRASEGRMDAAASPPAPATVPAPAPGTRTTRVTQSWHPSSRVLNVHQNINTNAPTLPTQPRLPVPDSNATNAPPAAAAATASRRGLEMSCQEAAAIIAAMRGGRYLYGDVEQSVRGELGCDADALLESCRVGNVRLMDVMDGEGG